MCVKHLVVWTIWVALLAGCSDDSAVVDGGRTDGVNRDTVGPLPDGYTLWPCEQPGKQCNAHDPCAIQPICGADKQCRPAGRQDCSDGLPCTVDTCMGMGLCSNEPVEGRCALAVQVGASDAGAGTTVIRCFAEDEQHPDDPCLKCDPQTSGTKWTGANGGYCDDGNSCTKDDYCSLGTCKGTYYGTQCADAYGCTEDLCDGKGGCLGNQLRSDWCLITGVCYKDGAKHPNGSCNICDVSNSQSLWTPVTDTCMINSVCYPKGDKHPLGCAECDPAVSTAGWTVKGSFCLIDNLCKKPGDKDDTSCASCDPTQNKYTWTPLPGVCKIGGKCYQTGDKHPLGCAECDPAVSASSWTVAGNDCLIYDVCNKPGDKDSIACGECDPTKNKYDWSPIAGLCKISGSCYQSGAQHPLGCAECDPAASASSWTVKGNDCLVYNVCQKPGDKDQSGCGSCDPTKSKYAWSALPGLCKIDGKCHQSGAQHPQGCAECDPTKTTTAWTVPGNNCLVDYKCYAAGVAHGSGCGSCDPTKSKTSWTVASSSCVIGDKCYPFGSVEVGGCGVCDPSKSKSSWTRPSGCLAVHEWSRRFGNTSSDYPWDVAVDGNGNVYITGYYYNSINFGGSTLTASSTSPEIFVASFTPSGAHRWSKSFGNTSSDYGYAIAVDGDGNVYVTGYFYNSINFGGSAITSAGSGDIFLASFTSAGDHRWSKGFGNTSSDYGYGVATDSAGNVYITGYHYNSVDFGGGAIASNGSGDIYVASFTTSGAHRWSKGFGGTSADYGYSIRCDGSDNVYVTGYFQATANFGGSAMTSKGSYDVFVASFTPSGVHRWSKGFGSTSSDYGYSIAVDSSANVYVAGSFYYDIDFGGGKITAGGRDGFVASFTTGGAHRWSKGLGGTSTDYSYGVATDPAGNAYVTGYFNTSADFGGGTLTSKGGYDIYLVSYTSSGAHRWSRSYGSSSSDLGRALATDAAGNLYATGYFYSSVDFGGGPLTSAGSYDIFLLKLAP